MEEAETQQPPDKLQAFYNSLRTNENIKGLPDSYDKFKAAMQDPAKAKTFHDALLGNESVKGLPQDFNQFSTALGLKKKVSAPVSNNTFDLSSNGLDNSQSSQNSNIPSFVQPNSPLAANIQEQDKQVRQQKQMRQDALNKQLQPYLDKLSPQDKQDLYKASDLSAAAHSNDRLSAPTQQETNDYNFSQTPTGKLVNGIKYLGSKASKGALQVAKGASYLATLGVNAQHGEISGDDPNIDKAFDKADKATDFLSKGDQSRAEDSKVMSNLGGLAEFLPSAVAGESTGGATFYLQGLGQGKEIMDKVKDVNPIVKNAFILGSGAVNGLLMGDLGHGLYNSLSGTLKDDVVTSITANAIKDAAGKDLTPKAFSELLQNGAKEWGDKAAQAGVNYLKNTRKAVVDLSGLNIANFALKKGVDAVSDKPVFNENLGNLADQESETLKAAPLFGALGSIGDASKLTPYSHYKNTAVEGLMRDPSDKNIEQVKKDFTEHAQRNPQDFTQPQLDASLQHIDEIGKIAKSLPRGIHHSQVAKAVDIVQNRNELQTQLDKVKADRESQDPAVNTILSPQEQLLTDKIDQANDKLQNIVRGSKDKITYSYDPEKDVYTKNIPGEKPVKITKSRYELEKVEKPNNEQTQSNQEVPAEQQADEAGQTGTLAENNDETIKNNINTNPTDNENSNSTSEGKEAESGQKEESVNREEEGLAAKESNVNLKEGVDETSPSNSNEFGITSRNNDAVDKSREKRGLPPLFSEQSKSNKETWDEAMSEIDKDPDAADKIITRFNQKPFAPNDVENAILLHKRLIIENEIDKLHQRIVDGEPTDQIDPKIDEQQAKLQELDDIDRKSGTMSGRSLQSRQLAAKNDFSLARMELRKRSALGRDLTPEERDDIRKIHDDYQKKQKELEAKIAELEEKERKRVEQEKLDDLKKQVKRERKSKTAEQRKRQRDDLIQDIRNKLKAQRKTQTLTSSIPFAQQFKELAAISPELAKLAKSYIAEGIDKLDDLVDKIHDDLKDAFEGLDKRAVRDALSGYGAEHEPQTKSEIQAKLDELRKQAKLISKLEDLEAKQYKAPEKAKPAISKEIEELRKQIKDLEQPDITARATKTRLTNEIEALSKQIATGEKPEKGTPATPDAETLKLKERRDELKKQLAEINKDEIDKAKRASVLKSLKTRTANQIAEYQRRIANRDFTKNVRTPIELDPEAITATANLQRIKDDYQAELEKDRLANRSTTEKVLDKALKYRRAELLLNIAGAVKVGMASMYRIIGQPIHELAGSAVRRIPILSRIAAKAPREGHDFNLNAEWKALKTVWDANTIDEVKKKFQGKLDNLDTTFGDKKEHFDIDRILDLAGNIHAAEKEFAKQNEFRRSVILRTKYAQEHGVDTDSPFVQLQIGKEALEDANRQIFMADNLATKSYKSIIRTLETAKEDKFGKSGKIGADVLKVLFPIVRVPTNFLIEKTQYTPVLGATKALFLMARGIDKLSPRQADYVLRVMKKQSLGAGLLALGYFNPQAFGGFRVPGGKRKDGDINAGDVKLFGVEVPHFLTHTPLLTIMQLGATIRRAADSYGGSFIKGATSGETVVATATDMAESTPFYETPKQVIRGLESSNNASQFAGDFLRGLIVPSVITQEAQREDKDENGDPVKRTPHGVWQGIESGIPGLRKNLDIKEPEREFNKIQVGEETKKLSNKQVQERQKFYDDFMKSDAAKRMKLEIAKLADKPKEQKKIRTRLKSIASKVSKSKILSKYHNAQTGGYDIANWDE